VTQLVAGAREVDHRTALNWLRGAYGRPLGNLEDAIEVRARPLSLASDG
jgi:hypothetical protein